MNTPGYKHCQLVQLETLKICQVKGWSQFDWLLALASVNGTAIHPLYPETGCIAFGKFAVKLLNVVVKSQTIESLRNTTQWATTPQGRLGHSAFSGIPQLLRCSTHFHYFRLDQLTL